MVADKRSELFLRIAFPLCLRGCCLDASYIVYGLLHKKAQTRVVKVKTLSPSSLKTIL